MCPWEVGNCQSLFYSLESESHLEPEFANFPTRLIASKAQRASCLHCSPLPSPPMLKSHLYRAIPGFLHRGCWEPNLNPNVCALTEPTDPFLSPKTQIISSVTSAVSVPSYDPACGGGWVSFRIDLEAEEEQRKSL